MQKLDERPPLPAEYWQERLLDVRDDLVRARESDAPSAPEDIAALANYVARLQRKYNEASKRKPRG